VEGFAAARREQILERDEERRSGQAGGAVPPASTSSGKAPGLPFDSGSRPLGSVPESKARMRPTAPSGVLGLRRWRALEPFRRAILSLSKWGNGRTSGIGRTHYLTRYSCPKCTESTVLKGKRHPGGSLRGYQVADEAPVVFSDPKGQNQPPFRPPNSLGGGGMKKTASAEAVGRTIDGGQDGTKQILS
jgi:hypothetical protein